MALSYFARVWMVQEVRDSKNEAVALWGNTRIPFIVIGFAATWGSDNSLQLNYKADGEDLVSTAHCSTVN